MPNRLELTVSADDAGKRLDLLLAERIEGLSRSAAQKLIERGDVLCGGKPADKKDKPVAGTSIYIELPEPVDSLPHPQEILLDIVYEDDALLVVNKPKGMVVHPAPGNPDGTLVNALLYHCGTQLSDLNGEIRPGILHRIDKNTSGLLVVAKNNRAHEFLAAQIQSHSFTREYEAVVHGVMKQETGTWEFPIGRNPVDRKKRGVNGENPKEAVTHFEVLQRFARFTYVKFRLETGRTHQIRVHSAYAGYPVAGDEVYGPKKCMTELNGQCLHAKKLGFIHPTKGKYLEFDSELPTYFQKFLQKVEKMR